MPVQEAPAAPSNREKRRMMSQTRCSRKTYPLRYSWTNLSFETVFGGADRLGGVRCLPLLDSCGSVLHVTRSSATSTNHCYLLSRLVQLYCSTVVLFRCYTVLDRYYGDGNVEGFLLRSRPSDALCTTQA
jgi:hypothetical protein